MDIRFDGKRALVTGAGKGEYWLFLPPSMVHWLFYKLAFFSRITFAFLLNEGIGPRVTILIIMTGFGRATAVYSASATAILITETCICNVLFLGKLWRTNTGMVVTSITNILVVA